jgi:hypothetical protein
VVIVWYGCSCLLHLQTYYNGVSGLLFLTAEMLCLLFVINLWRWSHKWFIKTQLFQHYRFSNLAKFCFGYSDQFRLSWKSSMVNFYLTRQVKYASLAIFLSLWLGVSVHNTKDWLTTKACNNTAAYVFSLQMTSCVQLVNSSYSLSSQHCVEAKIIFSNTWFIFFLLNFILAFLHFCRSIS